MAALSPSYVLKTFNNHFDDFVGDILRVFPGDKDIIAGREALRNMRKANPKIIINIFKETVVGPYHKQIKNNDISFFIEKNYTDEIADENSRRILSKIDIIREPVRNMNDADKNNVLKYLNNLLKLCDLYN
jgi:hypothetical protein